MSFIDDLYPAQQSKHYQKYSYVNPPHHHHGHRRHRHNNRHHRRPRPYVIGPRRFGPRRAMIGVLSLFDTKPSTQVNNKINKINKNNNNKIYDDIIKENFIEIEYNILFKYYRRKYFVLTSNFQLFYFDNIKDKHNNYIQNNKNNKNYINILNVISVKKINNNILEIEINNKLNVAETNLINFTSLLTPDISKWIFKFNKIYLRNEWFDSINFLISASKEDNNNDDNNDDDWCIINNNDLDLDIVNPPQQPGMMNNNNNNNNNNDLSKPPPFAPGYNNEGLIEHGDEGKVTLQ